MFLRKMFKAFHIFIYHFLTSYFKFWKLLDSFILTHFEIPTNVSVCMFNFLSNKSSFNLQQMSIAQWLHLWPLQLQLHYGALRQEQDNNQLQQTHTQADKDCQRRIYLNEPGLISKIILTWTVCLQINQWRHLTSYSSILSNKIWEIVYLLPIR